MKCMNCCASLQKFNCKASNKRPAQDRNLARRPHSRYYLALVGTALMRASDPGRHFKHIAGLEVSDPFRLEAAKA